MSFVRANFARGVLTSSLGLADATLTLNPGHTIPTEAGNMRFTLWDSVTYPDPSDDPSVEIVTAVYSGTSNVYNITRAQEVTSPSAHAIGSRVAVTHTAGVSNDDVLLVTTHIASTGVDHGYIDQDVTAASSPAFAGLDMTDGPISDVGYIDFNLINGIAQQEGRMCWNNTDGTVNLGLKGGFVNLQVGMEHVVRGKNTSGFQINDGEAVRINGAIGQNPTFALSDADSATDMDSVGLATEDISNNTLGYVTTNGRVRDVNTTGAPVSETWSDGDYLFVSNTAGKLTNIIPTGSERKIFIGIVLYSHATEGVIWVSVSNQSFLSSLSGVQTTSLSDQERLIYDSASSTWINGFPAMYTDMEEPTGFVDRDAIITWSDSSPDRTFTITGSHDIYIRGVKYTKSTNSIQLADTTGLHWVYYDKSGTLTENITFPGFDVPLMGTIYWNTTPGFDKGLFGEERHGLSMDYATHEYLHNTVGSRYKSGLAGTFDDTTLSIAIGAWQDEDLEHIISSPETTCNILYKNGSANWEWDAAQTVYYKLNGANLRYNDGNNLADASANRYIAMWIFITNDLTTPIVALMGQRQDVLLADARANNTYESLALGELPFEEMKVLFRVILRNTGTPPTWTEDQDLRSVSNLPGGTYVATEHGVLTGLPDDDHPQYLLADGTRALAGAWSMGNYALTNVNIDSGDINTAVVNTEWDAAYTHVSNNGSDHSYIDQSVVIAATPNFAGLGVNEAAPITQMEITGTSPYFTLHNSDETDDNVGRSCRWIARGEQSGGEETMLGYMEFAHDGSANDGKARYTIYTNRGSDGESPTQSFVIDSANAFYFRSNDNTDYISLYHNNSDAYLKWNDGVLIIENAETDTDGIVHFRGNGTGFGGCRWYDQDNAEYTEFYTSNSYGFLHTGGSSPNALVLQAAAHANVHCFSSATSGEHPDLVIYGYAAGDAKRELHISVGTGDVANTAFFSGLGTYNFDGIIQAGGNEIASATGNLTSANGASFGPGAVTSITVLNGIVTAIS